MGQTRGHAHQRRVYRDTAVEEPGIAVLKRGMRIHLPSGNTVQLDSRIGPEWIVTYLRGSEFSGQTVFTGEFLRRWGREHDHEDHDDP